MKKKRKRKETSCNDKKWGFANCIQPQNKPLNEVLEVETKCSNNETDYYLTMSKGSRRENGPTS